MYLSQSVCHGKHLVTAANASASSSAKWKLMQDVAFCKVMRVYTLGMTQLVYKILNVICVVVRKLLQTQQKQKH